MIDQPLLQFSISDIGVLDIVGFRTAGPVLDTPVTVALWMFAAGPIETQVIVNQGAETMSGAGWSIALKGADLQVTWQPTNVASVRVSTRIVDFSGWHHVAAVAGDELILYVDGRARGRAPLFSARLFPGEPPPLCIGGYTDAAGGHFDHTFGRNGSGLVDDVRIYRGVASKEEIAAFIPLETSSLPVAEFQHQVYAAATHRFEGVADMSARHYLWRFGDGVGAIGKVVTHRYAYGGTYDVKLTVVDEAYRMAEASKEIFVPVTVDTAPPQPVFINGTEGHRCYRIPAIVRAANGDLLAFAEGRVDHCSDSTDAIRLVMKRSRDNGASWEPLQIVARNIVNGRERAIQNISPVVDAVQGTGWVFVVYNLTEHSEWEVSEGKGINRAALRMSDNHGETWSAERDLTPFVHRPYNPDYVEVYAEAAKPENATADWRIQRPTLGHAIQLQRLVATRGRLFFAGTITRGDDSVFDAYNYVFWSDDLGATWEIGGIVDGVRSDGSSAQGLNEATAAELPSGEVMISSRNYRQNQPVGVRAVTIATFDENGNVSFSPTRHDESLVEPPIQAALLRLSFGDEPQANGKSRLLFCNAAHPKARYRLTLRLSYDEGKTWPVSRVVDPGPSAYCDLVLQANNDIGILYERGNQGGVYYATRTLSWLTEGRNE